MTVKLTETFMGNLRIMVGGVVRATAPRIVYCESVIVVMESGDAKDLLLCGAEAGQGKKLCFRTNCTTAAHKTRCLVHPLDSSIYIRCGNHELVNSYDTPLQWVP